MRNVVLAVAMLLVPCRALPQSAQAPKFSIPPPSEMVQIDGSKNPEMIPQWSSWEFAFRVINGGSKLLPSNVHHAASEEERALILAEAVANDRRDRACQERIEKLSLPQGKEKLEVLLVRQRDVQLDCRWQTLHARDRLLERLRPEVALELTRFVEDLKAGRKITVPKSGLAHYQQPQ